MFENNAIVFLYAVGVIDNPIQGGRHTNHPCPVFHDNQNVKGIATEVIST